MRTGCTVKAKTDGTTSQGTGKLRRARFGQPNLEWPLLFIVQFRVSMTTHVLLVGNYLPDGQESMLRFRDLLLAGLPSEGTAVETISPTPVFGRWLHPLHTSLGKWLAYVDKYLLFPIHLRRRVRALPRGAVVHICDHSNAVYAPPAGSSGHPVLVTCHDLGAVRGARGEATDCPASRTGRILQRWILRSLGRADMIACVSTATKDDVSRLVRRPDGALPQTRLVLNGLNAPYQPLVPAEADARLRDATTLDASRPFLLNVGSSLRRKNREGILRTLARIKTEWPGQVVFAGEALPSELTTLAGELGIESRVVQIIKPVHQTLEALYSRAFALLFPSTFEGFGWPVIEAQACGCPVLCSDAGSLPEVVGESAFVRAPNDLAAFGDECLRLANSPAARQEWIAKGLVNARRFTTGTMLDHYRYLYLELAANSLD